MDPRGHKLVALRSGNSMEVAAANQFPAVRVVAFAGRLEALEVGSA